MDVTALFKACVKTVKMRNKTLGIGNDVDKSILNRSKKCEFSRTAKEVVKDIGELRAFLLKHRKDYVNVRHLTSETGNMTDVQRDQIDFAATEFVRKCTAMIMQLKNEAAAKGLSKQAVEHRQGVLDLIQAYLKVVCKIFSDQRAVRIKRSEDLRRIMQFEPGKSPGLKVQTSLSAGTSKEETLPESLSEVSDRPKKDLEKTERPSKVAKMASDMDDEESGLSPEEIAQFEQENVQLYRDMNNIVEDVRRIEGSVVEITRLQEIFTEKVMEQEKDIDRIYDAVVGTTENVKEGNEQIREAMKNNAGFRVWILFFLVVMSLSLLFLDWYNA